MKNNIWKCKIVNVWMETCQYQRWKVHSSTSIMNLNISWTGNKEQPRAAQWMGHSFIVAAPFFQSYNMSSDHQEIILAALSVTFLHFSTPFSMEGHISVTSQITGCGKSSLVSRYCRNYGFGSLKCPMTYCGNGTFEWRYSLLSMECLKTKTQCWRNLDQFNFLFFVCPCFSDFFFGYSAVFYPLL